MANHRIKEISLAPRDVTPSRIPRDWAKEICHRFQKSPFSEADLHRLVVGGVKGLECAGIVEEGRWTRYRATLSGICHWFEKRVLPNTVVVTTEDPNFFRLLIFSLLITYKMHAGDTRMTISEFSARGKRRSMLQVVSDQFVGKIGEIGFSRFASQWGYEISLDWDFGREREAFANDLPAIKKLHEGSFRASARRVSIKSSKTLEGAWAESPRGYDLASQCKASVPDDFFFRVLLQISSMAKFLEFLSGKVKEDSQFSQFLSELKAQISETLSIPCYICGWFVPDHNSLVAANTELPFLGPVREDKHMVRVGELAWNSSDWNSFFEMTYGNL